MKHAKHPALPAAAALAAALLLAACAPAQDGPPQAPEYPWTDSCEQTLAALDEAGADYEVADDAATGVSVTMESGELFGVPVQDLYLRFDTNGTLEGVSGVVAPEQTDAMQAAMRKALGDPVDSYCPASYSALAEFGVELSADLVSQGGLYWHEEQPLSETLPEKDGLTPVQQWQKGLEAAGITLTEEGPETITAANGEERTVWHGTEALEQFLANNWEYLARYEPDGDGARVAVSRVIWPF